MALHSSIRTIDLDTLFDGLNQEPVRLLGGERTARIDIIRAFFPDMLCSGADTVFAKGGKTADILAAIPAGQRTFCHVCQQVDIAFKNYLNYFFTAQREKSTACRSLFVSLFGSDADPVELMAQKCAAVLKREGLDVLPASDSRRSALLTAMEKAMDALMSRFPAFSVPREVILGELQENPAQGLARVIASYAVYLDPTGFKNDRKRHEMTGQIQSLLYDVWKLRPEDVAWQSSTADGIRAFHAGDYPHARAHFAEAERLLQEEDRRSNFQTAVYADLLSYQAHMLMDGSAGERSLDQAYQLIRKACRVTNLNGGAVHCPRRWYESAFFQLFYPEEWAHLNQSGSQEDAAQMLERASAEGCVDAMALLAELCFTGAYGYEHLKNTARGVQLLEAGAAREDAYEQERARCELRLAQHYMQTQSGASADVCYEKAARLGSYDAVVHLREKHFSPTQSMDVQISASAVGRAAFFNTEDGMNSILRASLPQAWETCCGSVCELLKRNPLLLQKEQLLFSFMAYDERKNLQDALQALKLLNSVAYAQTPECRDAFIDRIDLFVLLREETGRMMLDAAMNSLAPEVFFRVHLCDPDLMAANELLLHYPTFFPCFDAAGEIREEQWKHQKKNERCQRRIALLGTSGCAAAIVRQIAAATMLEDYPTQLAVIGPSAAWMHKRMQEECPGLFSTDAPHHITPRFFECDLATLPLNRTGEGAEADLHAFLYSANQLIVAGEDDMSNISLAVRLRTSLFRAHLQQGAQPMINVLYRDGATQWIASQIAVGAANADTADRYHWTENYDLRLFGSSFAFRYEQLMNRALEKRALEIHKSYYGLNIDRTHERRALADYYRRSYNRDSSLCLALGMVYHCFGMGVYHTRLEDYADRAKDAVLGQRYDALMSADESLRERAAGIEHTRWMGWSLSRGWIKPDDAVLAAYIRMNSPRHYLEIARLHPYITGYHQLLQESEKINDLRAAYQFQPRMLPDPRQSDRELTRLIPQFLGYEKPDA